MKHKVLKQKQVNETPKQVTVGNEIQDTEDNVTQGTETLTYIIGRTETQFTGSTETLFTETLKHAARSNETLMSRDTKT